MKGKLNFTEHHLPALKTGRYDLTLVQTLEGPKIPKNTTFPAELRFAVQAERFNLAPTLINAVFPPAGSLGDFSTVMPHIVLNRSTLPWERDIVVTSNHFANDKEHELESKEYENTPWLALLVFEEKELDPSNGESENSGKAISGFDFSFSQVKDLKSTIRKEMGWSEDDTIDWPGISEDPVTDEEERLTIILPTYKVLKPLLPSLTDLKYLSHIRHEDHEGADEEKAVLIARRLPKAKTNTVVHLVSLENRFKNGEFFLENAKDETIIPLVSLKSWRFTSLSARHNFRGLMLHLNHTPIFRAIADTLLQRKWTNGIPTLVKNAFSQANAPLLAEVQLSDTGFKEIFAGVHQYLLGKSGKIYDKAGHFLQEISGFNPESTTLKEDIKNNLKGRISLSDELQIKDCPQKYWWIADEDHHYFLDREGAELVAYRLFKDETPTLRMQETDNELTNKYLRQGFVPFPHYFRQGSKTVSWYRGPLAPSEQEFHLDAELLHVNSSDHLLRYHQDTGLFDVSLAAAWELGRLLALSDKNFSVKLEKWKRSHRRFVAQVEQKGFHIHLPFGNKGNVSDSTFPTELWKWLYRLLDLEGVPFNYLVPKEEMLPPESIRFFYLDPNWLHSLFLGAFSLGRPITERHGSPLWDIKDPDEKVVGFILRSAIVSGWPDLQVEAYATKDGHKDAFIPPLYIQKYQVSENILLCLINGEPKEIDFFLKPKALHFGFHQDNTDGPYKKTLRDSNGEEHSIPMELSDAVFNGEFRTLSIEELTKGIKKKSLGFSKDLNAAEFALAMIEGVDRFKLLR